MFLEPHIQNVPMVVGHICDAHRSWETAPIHPRCALFIQIDVRPFHAIGSAPQPRVAGSRVMRRQRTPGAR